MARRLIAEFARQFPGATLSDRAWRRQLAAWLSKISRERDWARAYWRLCRSALVGAARQDMGAAEADWMLNEINEADRALYAIHGPHRRWSAKRGKAREVHPHDLRRIVAQLEGSQSIYAALASRWLKANMHVGLRPSEWDRAELDLGSRTLLVHNAKHTNGRAHGEARTVHLADLPQADWEEIARFSADLDSLRHAHAFTAVYDGARTALRRARKALTRQGAKIGSVSLYSTRHQFTADLRASGRTPAEIAALLGHATTDTQREHYGRRAKGRAGRKAAADSADLARVRTVEHPSAALARKRAASQDRPAATARDGKLA